MKPVPWRRAAPSCCALLCLVLASCHLGEEKDTFTIHVLSGTITVDNADYRSDTIVVSETMDHPRLEGVFSASVYNGINPDIIVCVMDGPNYANWRSTEPPGNWSYYYTSGKATMGSISASLPSTIGDTYYLIYDNRFDMFRDKDVYRRVDLIYEQ